MVDAIRLAAELGCEIIPAGDGRIAIRAINYDADPYELEERRLLAMTAEEFLKEWIPPHYEP